MLPTAPSGLNKLTDGDLTDAAVEGSGRNIVAATAGLTIYNRWRDHTSGTARCQVYNPTYSATKAWTSGTC